MRKYSKRFIKMCSCKVFLQVSFPKAYLAAYSFMATFDNLNRCLSCVDSDLIKQASLSSNVGDV
jgi:hypothetical protein